MGRPDGGMEQSLEASGTSDNQSIFSLRSPWLDAGKEEEFYYPCSENKGADQLRS